MNVVAFELDEDGRVDVLVDGQSLSNLLRVGTVEAEDFPTLVERWRNRSDASVPFYDAPEGWVPLLNCGCGDWGCGGIPMHVETSRGTIKWCDLSAPDGSVRLGVGPYVFRWDQFEEARASIQTLLTEVR